MSPSFLVESLCYTSKTFTITLASSAFISPGSRLILKDSHHHKSADDASVTVKGLHV